MSMGVTQIGTTASEQMFFGGAPLAHVVLYYELQSKKRRVRLRELNKIRQHQQLILCLAQLHGADRPGHISYAEP